MARQGKGGISLKVAAVKIHPKSVPFRFTHWKFLSSI